MTNKTFYININNNPKTFFHSVVKHALKNSLLQFNRSIEFAENEVTIGNRKADIFCKLTSGKKIAIEIQNSNTSIKEIAKKTKEYHDLGIYTLWILNARGRCVAESKPNDPQNQFRKNVKVSPIEKYLHKMYGGRVYYVDMCFRRKRTKKYFVISSPYAIHYALASSRKHRNKEYKKRFNRYFVYDAIFNPIPDLNFLCVNFNGVSIARFYDKTISNEVKESVLGFLNDNKKTISGKSSKVITKLILAKYKRKYGESIVYNALCNLREF